MFSRQNRTVVNVNAQQLRQHEQDLYKLKPDQNPSIEVCGGGVGWMVGGEVPAIAEKLLVIAARQGRICFP